MRAEGGLATCPRPETTWLDLTSHLHGAFQSFWGSQVPVGTPGLGEVYALHRSESKADIWESDAAGEGHWG